MKLFAPNILVVGDTIYGLDDAVGRPQPPALAAQYESEIMSLRQQIQNTRFGAQWLEIVGNNVEPIVIVPTTKSARSNAVSSHKPRTDATAS